MEHQRKQRLFRADAEAAWALFQQAPAVRFAAVASDGSPVLRTVNAVVLDQRLYFHGTDHGEKLKLVGSRAVASYDEVVAEVPSYWIHPELACPASTYYVSALAEGTIERVSEPEQKARALSALMERFQPEGGYRAITARDRGYAKVLDTLMVAAFVPSKVSGKAKLGQHRTIGQIERVLEGLWRRGRPGDLSALRLIREAHPGNPQPAFLRGPHGSELCVAPDARDAEEVAALLAGQYWTTAFSPGCMAAAQLGSSAWVVARDAATRSVLASARAVSDRARFGHVLDVIVRADARRKGFARTLMGLLLDHPALRSALTITLRTRDAQALYDSLGFVRGETSGDLMTLVRA